VTEALPILPPMAGHAAACLLDRRAGEGIGAAAAGAPIALAP